MAKPCNDNKLTTPEYYAVRGSLANEIQRMRGIPGGDETQAFREVMSAYEKVIRECEKRVPRDRFHPLHRAILEGREEVLH